MVARRASFLLACLFPAALIAAGPAGAARRRARRKAGPAARVAKARGKITIDSVRKRLALAGKSLEYVEASSPRPELAAELGDVTRAVKAAGADADPKRLFERVSALRRR
ncbi:MAG: hypothetical protein ACYS9X_30195, partial [Planctomycetota bacterium]